MFLKNNSRFLYIYAFILLLISASYGLLLRWNFTFPIVSFPYQNMVQSHSHVAFLGWGYLVSIGAVIQLIVKNNITQKSVYNYCIGIISISIALMLISFPIAGYKAFSVVLLTIFGLTSYVLSYRLLLDIKGKGYALKLIRFAIYYYILSSLATWFLAGVMLTQGKTDLYYNTVYFYLHFLYNGYFVFVLFGLLFKIFERQKIFISEKYLKAFFIYLNAACIPAYTLSILWSGVAPIFYVIGFAASVLQLISLIFLFFIFRNAVLHMEWSVISRLLLKFSMLAYGLKIILQIMSSFPYFVEKSLALKPFFIIGYLHLFTLGFMSVLLLLILNQLKNISMRSKISILGISAFLVGVFCTELLMFLQGGLLLLQFSPIGDYNIMLLSFYFLVVLGLIAIFVKQFNKNNKIN